jgi:hypothetical protein
MMEDETLKVARSGGWLGPKTQVSAGRAGDCGAADKEGVWPGAPEKWAPGLNGGGQAGRWVRKVRTDAEEARRRGRDIRHEGRRTDTATRSDQRLSCTQNDFKAGRRRSRGFAEVRGVRTP